MPETPVNPLNSSPANVELNRQIETLMGQQQTSLLNLEQQQTFLLSLEHKLFLGIMLKKKLIKIKQLLRRKLL